MAQERQSCDTASGRSLAVPLVLATVAPLVVIVTIEYLHNLWWTFAIYQLGICLVAPVLESRRSGCSWREHAFLLGLLGPPRRRILGVALGLATALVTGGFLVLTRDRFLDPVRLETTVAQWGVPPEQLVATLAVMAGLNAVAEELFWRGYLPGRVAAARPSSPPPVILTVVLPALLYASYHGLTIGRLVGEIGGVVLMTSGVLGAGLFWGWLRRRTGSVWPPLLGHGGAVVAYLAVHYWLMATGRG